jgi:hypothetical protein
MMDEYDSYERWCDTRLWMMDLEDDCRRVIEAMPAERRGRFDLTKIVSGEALGLSLEQQALNQTVYFAASRRVGREAMVCFIPFAEAMLKDVDYTHGCADQLLARAEGWFAEQEAAHA